MGYLGYIWSYASWLTGYDGNTKQVADDKIIKDSIATFTLPGDPRYVLRSCTLRIIVETLDYDVIKTKISKLCEKDQELATNIKISKVLDYFNRNEIVHDMTRQDYLSFNKDGMPYIEIYLKCGQDTRKYIDMAFNSPYRTYCIRVDLDKITI